MTTILVLLLLVLAQGTDLASAALFAAFDWEGVRYLRYGRDLLTVGLFAFAFAFAFARLSVSSALRVSSLAYLGIIVLYMLAGAGGDTPMGLMAGSAGKLGLPVLFTFAGMIGLRTAGAWSAYMVTLLALALSSVAFGAWEIKHTEFWTSTVEYGEYLYQIKDVLIGYNGEEFLPFNFFGYEQVRRAAGLVASPLAQGSFLATAGVLAFAHYRTPRLWLGAALLVVMAWGVYQSGTRGAVLMMIVAMPLSLALGSRRFTSFGRDLILLAIGIGLSFETLLTIYSYTVNLEDGSTIGHLTALERNLEELHTVLLIGAGLGGAGSLAADLGQEIAGGGEGALFSILFQIGGPGAVAFLCFYGAVIADLLRMRRLEGRIGSLGAGACGMAVGAASSLVLSEHLLTISGMAPFWLAVGGILAQGYRAIPTPVPAPVPVQRIAEVAR